jgi:predicted regulator of Ras-like GTPase activity (Roadblock/LC7/MglB family)
MRATDLYFLKLQYMSNLFYSLKKIKSQQTNEVDEIMKDLKRYPGFKAYIIMTNDGIVIRWDQVDSDMPYERAVHHASLVLDLCSKTKTHMQNLFEVRIQQGET